MNLPPDIIDVVEDLIKHSAATREYIDNAYTVKPYLLDLVKDNMISEKDFYNITSFLTPQARSPLWQNYFIAKIGADKVKAAANKGDLLWNGRYYEYKISGFNADRNLHIIQIRKWQHCDYVIQYVNADYNPPITFLLEHEQMVEELSMLKGTSAHGTKKANEDNTNIEFRCSVKFGSEDWKRWQDLYKKDI